MIAPRREESATGEQSREPHHDRAPDRAHLFTERARAAATHATFPPVPIGRLDSCVKTESANYPPRGREGGQFGYSLCQRHGPRLH